MERGRRPISDAIMTTLLYRGQAYEQRSAAHSSPNQLRYDREVYSQRQQDARQSHALVYRGCQYNSGERGVVARQGDYCYRGVAYSL